MSPEPADRRHQSTSRTCEERGCVERTKEGKPYCLTHLDRMPYVAKILATVARVESRRLRSA